MFDPYTVVIFVVLKSLAIFSYLWKSSVIFINFRKMFGNFHVSFGKFLEDLWKAVGSLQKIVRNVVISMSI